MADEYPRDEFDQIAESAGPVGVHRAPRPWWILVVTPIVVFVIAGLLAFLVAQILWDSGRDGANPSTTPSVTASASASASPSASASASAAPSASSTPTPSETTPAPVVDYGAAVTVLNGAGISGLAASQVSVLEGAGFTNVVAENFSGTKPSDNTIVYADESQKATADAVAAALGYGTVVQGTPTTADTAVEVQIVSDPR